MQINGDVNSAKPNVLFIMADQFRSDYLGCMGADFVHTPNIDRLAAGGYRFTNCFTNSPLCAPARIALASGLQPARLGARDNSSYLPPHVPTFYQRLRDNGYRVGCVGKLDLAKPDRYNGRNGDRPRVYQFGFTHPEECEGKMHAGSSPEPLGPYGFFLQERGLYEQFHNDYKARAKNGFLNAQRNSILPPDAFEDAYIGRRAAEWIERVPDDYPWFQFVSFVGPHNPYDPPDEYSDKYRHADVPGAIRDSLDNKPAWVKRKKVTDDPGVIAKTRRQYCASIELIDDQIGLILSALENRGLLDSTYIVFTSDHGDMLGDHGLYRKSVAYEQAIHIPLIVSGPGIRQGNVSDALIELIDLNPTVCEWAGLPAQPHLDARSIAPLLSGHTTLHRTEIVSSLYNFNCLRTEKYKFIVNFNDSPELYDLTEDPGEIRNIAGEQDELVRKLSQRLEQRVLDGIFDKEEIV